jgi:hypothetical protein
MDDPVEQSAIRNVIDRLAERFPTLGRERVESVVREESARLADATVRAYVPALVEHAADERLRQEADPVDLGAGDPGGPVLADDGSALDPLEVERRAREQRAGFLFGDPGGGSV